MAFVLDCFLGYLYSKAVALWKRGVAGNFIVQYSEDNVSFQDKSQAGYAPLKRFRFLRLGFCQL